MVRLIFSLFFEVIDLLRFRLVFLLTHKGCNTLIDTGIFNGKKIFGSSRIKPGAVFLRIFTVAFLLFLATAGPIV